MYIQAVDTSRTIDTLSVPCGTTYVHCLCNHDFISFLRDFRFLCKVSVVCMNWWTQCYVHPQTLHLPCAITTTALFHSCLSFSRYRHSQRVSSQFQTEPSMTPKIRTIHLDTKIKQTDKLPQFVEPVAGEACPWLTGQRKTRWQDIPVMTGIKRVFRWNYLNK